MLISSAYARMAGTALALSVAVETRSYSPMRPSTSVAQVTGRPGATSRQISATARSWSGFAYAL